VPVYTPVWEYEGTVQADFQALAQFSGTAGASSTFPRRRSPCTSTSDSNAAFMQSIEESCDSYSELRIHARVPVLARPLTLTVQVVAISNLKPAVPAVRFLSAESKSVRPNRFHSAVHARLIEISLVQVAGEL
jgi:hypothetical protein